MTICTITTLIQSYSLLLEPLVIAVPGSCPAQNILDSHGDQIAILWLSKPYKVEQLHPLNATLIKKLESLGVTF